MHSARIAAPLLVFSSCATAPPAQAPPVQKFSCARFEDPLNRDPYPVKGALIKNRVVPLKVELRDATNAIVSDKAISAAPVVRVFIDGIDRTDLAGAMDVGRKGAFVFMKDGDHPEGHWKYDLVLEDFPVPSLVNVSIASGDEGEYKIEPTCVARIKIE